jgi:tRNA A37 threonylcarbamoyladenosine modification protein TsaB
MQQSKVLVISISNPIIIGIYQNNTLIETISKIGKTSDILPLLFDVILKKYRVNEIYYVSGPGSYMAIKIAYIFLKTISIVKNIPLFAISGFDLNNNSPIKALGKKYFFRDNNKLDDDKITIEFLNDEKVEPFTLPQKFENIKYTEDTLPKYNLPAV